MMFEKVPHPWGIKMEPCDLNRRAENWAVLYKDHRLGLCFCTDKIKLKKVLPGAQKM